MKNLLQKPAKPSLISLAVFLVSQLSPPTMAADWSQWRGPQRDGVSAETGLMKTWPKEGPPLVWQTHNAGGGYSTPSIVGDKVFLIGNEGLAGEFVLALSVKDGKKLWSATIGKVGNPAQQPSFPGARSTPSIEGGMVYALSSDGDLACLEAGTGREKWRKSLRRDFGGAPGQWAYAESPLIDGEALICTPGGADATLVALNKTTGDLIWKCAVPGQTEAGYASPVVAEIAGVKQYVQFLPKGLVGVEAKSGKLLWRYERSSKNSPAPIVTPLVENGFVYAGAYRAGGGLIHVVKKGETFETEEVYFSAKMPFGNGSVIKSGEYFFGEIGPALACVEFKTGNIKWEERVPGPSACVLAEGLIYCHCESGEVVVFEPSGEAYHEKGRFNPPGLPSRGDEMDKAWTHPVLANGRLYIRDKESLWCYDVRSGR